MSQLRRLRIISMCFGVALWCSLTRASAYADQAQGDDTQSAPAAAKAPDPPQPLFTFPLTEDGAATTLAETLKCSPDRMASVTQFLFQPAIFFVWLALITVALVADLILARRRLQLNLGNRVLALCLVMTLFRWHASLQQKASETRSLEVANATAAETPIAVSKMLGARYPGTTPEEYDEIRYVYLQLDNLDHAMDRYTNGFSSAVATARVIMTFTRYCEKSPVFARRAAQQVRLAAYSPCAEEVVTQVIQRLPRR